MPQAEALHAPLRDNLRSPKSIDAEIHRSSDRYTDSGLVIVVFGSLLVIELVQWLVHIPTWIMVCVSAVLLLAATVRYLPRMLRERAEVNRLRTTRDGERAVAEGLDLLRNDGHRVFHHVVGADFNIGHVVVGTKGIFTVQTETLSARAEQIYFDGERVRAGDAELPGNLVAQARAQAEGFKKTLFDSTSEIFGVKPVVVFPGRSVERTPAAEASDTWVLEPGALQRSLQNEPDRMTAEDVNLVSFHLERYIRASDA